MTRIETTILKNLIHDEDYLRKVVPHLSDRYFGDQIEKAIAENIIDFFGKYNKAPTQEILAIELGNRKDLFQDDFKKATSYIDKLTPERTNKDWLLDETEKWCKNRAVYNSIMDSIKIIDGRDKQHNQDAIPHLLQTALGVSFDKSVGHDYLDDYEARYEFYHRVEEKIPFDLDMLNTITRGGLSNKTLNIILAGTGVGKSLFMCHHAASVLMQGKNLLYISLEMAEERIAERIDANLLNLGMDELKVVDKTIFGNRVSKIAGKTQGKLIVKEYPTASAHSGHFRALLEELKMKRDFTPDIVFIDYLNICASQRLRAGGNINSYTYVKAIAEELRGLGVEYNVPIVSATQTTRSGYTNTDLGLEDTSESFGLPATADLMIALISTEELEELGQLMVKQLKNRYNDPSYYKRFVIGVDRSKMKLFNVELSAQQNIADSGQGNQKEEKSLFDQSPIGKRLATEGFKF